MPCARASMSTCTCACKVKVLGSGVLMQTIIDIVS